MVTSHPRNCQPLLIWVRDNFRREAPLHLLSGQYGPVALVIIVKPLLKWWTPLLLKISTGGNLFTEQSDMPSHSCALSLMSVLLSKKQRTPIYCILYILSGATGNQCFSGSKLSSSEISSRTKRCMQVYGTFYGNWCNVLLFAAHCSAGYWSMSMWIKAVSVFCWLQTLL